MVSYNNAAKAILSIILNNGERAFEEASTYLKTEHFIKIQYKVIWDSAQWLYDEGSTINRITILKDLEVKKDSEGNPNAHFLGQKPSDFLYNLKSFAQNEPIDNIADYAKMMLDEYVVTKNCEMCSLVMAEKTAGKQIKIIEEYAPIWYASDTKKYQTASDILKEMAQDAEKGLLNKDRDIKNSLPFLSEYLTMTPTNTTVIAGDTGHGKSSLALQLVYDIARQQVPVIDPDTRKVVLDEDFNEKMRNRTVLFLSMEMEKHEVVGKLFCNRFNMSWLEMKALPEKEFAKLADEMAEILSNEMPNLVIESGDMSLADCKKHIANVDKKFGGIDIVVFDHIGLLSDVYEHGSGKEHERYKHVSRHIKMKIAVKMNTHCILLSQLNKAGQDSRGKIDHTPTVDRLFGSSGIKQDATNVVFVYREAVLPQETTVIKKGGKAMQISTYFISRLIVAKSRFGEVTSAKPVGFIPYIQRFVPLSKIAEFGLINSDDSKFRLTKEQFATI